MSEFTKEQLAKAVSYYTDLHSALSDGGVPLSVVEAKAFAAFALALLERAEKDQRELVERGKDIHTLTCALESERLRAENAEAERDRLREDRRTLSLDELVYGTRAMHEVVDLRAERDRLKKELEEATARGPHYIRDSRLRAEGMRAAAEIARNLRPKDACTCGNYLSFRNGVPGHLPGCLVGECIDVADEIEGRAEEIDRSNRE